MYSLGFYIGLIMIGVVVGFISGLLGIGGGFLMVPFQYFLLTSEGIGSSLAMVVSIATSLAIIIPTALSGTYRHQKANKSIIKLGITLGAFGIFGSFFGGLIAIYIPIYSLQVLFSIFLIFVAINMLLDSFKDDGSSEDDGVDNGGSESDNGDGECCGDDNGDKNGKLGYNIVYFACIGSFVGIMSGLLGIGGGIILIPILTILFGFKLTKSIGTSSVFMSLTAIGGVISYIYSGWGVNTLPLSLGYVSLVNWALIVMFSVPMAYLGAKCIYKVSEKKLKIIFAMLILFIVCKMLGFLPF